MRWMYALILSLPLQCVWAQQNSPQPMPSPEEVNPAVDTTPAATPPPPPAAPAAPAPAPARATHAAAPSPRPTAEKPAPEAKGPGKSTGRGATPDRVELGTTDITGNRELPKVLYIVPWKRSDLGDLVGKPPNSLLDEVLQPIDRDVFLRENRYYDALQTGHGERQPDTVPGSGDKPSK